MAKFWGYLKTWFGKKSEELKDPEVELEQAIREAQVRDQQLRTQAAQVLAHRSRVAAELEEAADELAEAKELAKQALLKADAAAKAGNAEEAARWNQAASSVALKMQAAQNTVDMLTKQLQVATQQAEQAKQAVQTNAMQVQELSARRMQLLGQLQQAKMQETVNKAMEQLTATVGSDAPSLEEIENKIQARMAQAAGRAELAAATPEGAIAELQKSTLIAKAESQLDALRAELGLGSAGELPAAESPPASS